MIRIMTQIVSRQVGAMWANLGPNPANMGDSERMLDRVRSNSVATDGRNPDKFDRLLGQLWTNLNTCGATWTDFVQTWHGLGYHLVEFGPNLAQFGQL